MNPTRLPKHTTMNTHFALGLRALALSLALPMGLLATANDAEARPRGRAHIGMWVGGPLWWGMPFYGPGFGYGYGHGYGYPYVVGQPVIVHQPEPALVLPARQSHSWYYCPERRCTTPTSRNVRQTWQEVPATPEPPHNAAGQAPAGGIDKRTAHHRQPTRDARAGTPVQRRLRASWCPDYTAQRKTCAG